MIVEIDQFWDITTEHGRFTADAVLAAVTATVARLSRPYQWLGRLRGEEVLGISWGGEELVQILSNTTAEESLEAGLRLQEEVTKQPFTLPDGSLVEATVSIGVATMDPGGTLEEALNYAESALRKAKGESRWR